MWSNLPFDLLANIFSYLPADSIARARAACRNWRSAAEELADGGGGRHPAWFVALPARSWGVICCYAHNPFADSWHVLGLDRSAAPMRPIATMGGLILVKLASTTWLQLAVCNPFTNQLRALPALRVARTNPAVGVVGNRIYVAGGMSEAGGVYEATVEMYEGTEWRVVGAMPAEFAVRLTVWTPNESVWSDGVLYWMTSARVYSVMGYHTSSNRWREVGVPMGDTLHFAALVRREAGKLAVVGASCGGVARVWELGLHHRWGVVGEVPSELGVRLVGEKLNWGSVKCVGGIHGTICLYKDVGSGIIVWRSPKWEWIHGCSFVPAFPIKGMLLQPNLSRSTFYLWGDHTIGFEGLPTSLCQDCF